MIPNFRGVHWIDPSSIEHFCVVYVLIVCFLVVVVD